MTASRTRPTRSRLTPRLEALEDRLVPATALGFDDFANVVGTDASGNVYVSGSASQHADLDPGTGTRWASGGYLAKYSPDMQMLWARQGSDLDAANP